MHRRPARSASDRHKEPTAGRDVRHWRNIYFRRCLSISIFVNRMDFVSLAISQPYYTRPSNLICPLPCTCLLVIHTCTDRCKLGVSEFHQKAKVWKLRFSLYWAVDRPQNQEISSKSLNLVKTLLVRLPDRCNMVWSPEACTK